MRSLILITLVVLASCRPSSSPGEGLGWARCRVEGWARVVECASLEAPLRHEAPERGSLTLRVVRIPAGAAEATEGPLLMLAGGPGQAASEAFAPLLGALHGVTAHREVILLDQRGTGASAPLDCPSPDTLAEQLRSDELAEVAATCPAEHPGVDWGAFTTAASVADLELLRERLRQEELDLLGVSYGTRLALAYARAHPEHTRSLVLDGMAPPQLVLPLPFAQDAQAALADIDARCQAQASCDERFGALPALVERVLARAEEEPAIDVTHPRTGAPLHVELDRDLVAQLLRGLMYGTDLQPLFPLTLERAAEGDFGPLVAQAALLGDGAAESMSMGLFMSVVCAEDVPAIEAAGIEAATEGTFLGRAFVDDLIAACQRWPVTPVSVDRAPLTADVPTLAISGGADPATPPRWAERVVEALPRARHVVVPHAGHGNFMRGCLPRVVRDFLSDPGGVESLEVECAADFSPGPFFTDRLGPP